MRGAAPPRLTDQHAETQFHRSMHFLRNLSVVKYSQRGSAITRFQSKKQCARFPYVAFIATLSGRFESDRCWMICPADESQCIRELSHRFAIDRRFVHSILPLGAA
jgi:hypothetical protein